MRYVSRRNRIAAFMAYIAGVLLIVSGTTGVASWERIQKFALTIVDIPLVKTLFILALVLASLGGVTVIVGGLLIKRNFVRTGKFLIWLGSGIGIFSMAVNLFTTITNEGLSLVALFSLAPIGIILAFASQIIAKPERF